MRLWAVIPIVVMVLSIGLVPAVVYGSRPEPGIYLDLRVYNITNGRLADITQSLKGQRGVVTCVFVEFVEPKEGVPIAFKCFEGVPVVFIPYKLLEPGLRKWWETLSKQGASENVIRTTKVGLIVSINIYDVLNNRSIIGLNSLPITLDLFKNPKAIQYTLALRKEISQLVPIEKKEITTMPPNVRSVAERSVAEENATKTVMLLLSQTKLAELTERTIIGPSGVPPWCSCSIWGVCLCYYTLADITPEILQQQGALPPNYFTVGGDGLLYVATPVLIIDNTQNRGFIRAWIFMNRTDAKLELRLSFSTDKISDKLPIIPSINIQLGEVTLGGQGYYGDANLYVCPGTAQWAYIWARPIFKWYIVFRYLIGYQQLVYDHDEIKAYISAILASGPRILTGRFNGLPAATLMETFFSGVNITNDIPYLKYPFDPGSSCQLRYVFQGYDTCGSGFEVGIPVGAIAATAFCKGDPLCAAMIAIASSFQVSLDYEPASIYIDGKIENAGAVNFGLGCPAQDTRVYMYVATSRFRYVQPPPWWCFWCSPCYYKVPAGIYVKIVSAS